MSECENCGGFVTDNYARVFGDNEDRVHECRHCPRESTGSADEETDDRQVLLSDVRGGDVGDDDSGDTSGPSTRGDGAAGGGSTVAKRAGVPAFLSSLRS